MENSKSPGGVSNVVDLTEGGTKEVKTPIKIIKSATPKSSPKIRYLNNLYKIEYAPKNAF